jgi:hypothetical protein
LFRLIQQNWIESSFRIAAPEPARTPVEPQSIDTDFRARSAPRREAASAERFSIQFTMCLSTHDKLVLCPGATQPSESIG